MMTDEELVALAQAGDDAAMNDLIARHTHRVRYIASPYYNPGADREDVHQEGLIGLVKAVRDFDPKVGTSFVGFATLAVTRQLITMLKTATRQKHFALNYATRLDAPLMLDGTTNTVADVTADRLGVDPIETMLHGELAALIVTAVCDDAMLSALESEAVLGYMQQKSYVQISEDVKRPLKSVDNALQRATRKIVASVRARVGPLLFDSMELPREEAPVAAR